MCVVLSAPQVEVDSGVESVQLPFITTVQLPEDTTVKWTDSSNRTVDVQQSDSNQPGEQHWFCMHHPVVKRILPTFVNLSLTLKYPIEKDTDTYTCTVSSRVKEIKLEKQVQLKVKGQSCR